MKLGVCSWSLRPASPEALAHDVGRAGLAHVQLALEPLARGAWDPEAVRDTLAARGVSLLSGMMTTVGEDYTSLATIRATGGLRPDAHWAANLATARSCARLARRLELPLVSFHAGFLPHDAADPERARLLDRLREVADVFAEAHVALALETGQERAETLLDVLAELARPNVGVNFDPANMILYGMGDPIEAMRLLAPHVQQVHMKDATATGTPGQWGAEVPAGTGEVNWPAFFEIVRTLPESVGVMIEREAGDERDADIATARELAEQVGYRG